MDERYGGNVANCVQQSRGQLRAQTGQTSYRYRRVPTLFSVQGIRVSTLGSMRTWLTAGFLQGRVGCRRWALRLGFRVIVALGL
jgi:hypothetical protein